MPGPLSHQLRRAQLSRQPTPAILEKVVNDNLVDINHGLCTRAIIERSVRGADMTIERGRTHQRCCGGTTGLWHHQTSPALLCIAATMVITIALVQPTKLLHARRGADFASHGLTQAKRLPASMRTAPWTDDAVPRPSRRVGGWLFRSLQKQTS